MKTINNYINMKHINTYIVEKLRIPKNQKVEHTLFPTSKKELQEMIEKEIKEHGNHCSLNHIDVSKIIKMDVLFFYRPLRKFDGDISQWDVSNVDDMYRMFGSCSYTGDYGDISGWDVSKVNWMDSMFESSKYNGDISNWDVSSVKSMTGMFSYSDFDGDLSQWDVSNVTNMSGMFYGSKYTGENGNIGDWNISHVVSMESMFEDSEFSGNISSWKINGSYCNCNLMLADCKKLEKRYYPTINR